MAGSVRTTTILAVLAAAGCGGAPVSAEIVQAGPMLGYSGSREVALWVQTVRPAAVQVRYWPETKPGFALLTPRRQSLAEDANAVTLRVGELDPGTVYRYEVVVNGSPIDRAYPLRFRTEPHWQWRTDPPDFSVAIGSCAYVNEPDYDRPGEPYGGDFQIFGNILRERPQLMIWMGDNVYTREGDWLSREALARRYGQTRRLPELQALLGNVHHYATWDDHDYGPDNSDRSFPLKGAALEVFRLFWANPTYGLPDLPGVFSRFHWGDAEFFLLDDRTYRTPSDAPDDDAKTMWGTRQLEWLIDGLTASRARFKVVVNGSQMLNPFGNHETMAGFSHDRSQLLEALQQRNIGGVLFVTGDRHFSELARLERPGTYPLFEFTSSPLTAGVAQPAEKERDNPLRLPGTLVTRRSFGILSFAGKGADRALVLRALDSDGRQVWEHRISADAISGDHRN